MSMCFESLCIVADYFAETFFLSWEITCRVGISYQRRDNDLVYEIAEYTIIDNECPECEKYLMPMDFGLI